MPIAPNNSATPAAAPIMISVNVVRAIATVDDLRHRADVHERQVAVESPRSRRRTAGKTASGSPVVRIVSVIVFSATIVSGCSRLRLRRPMTIGW